MQTFCRDNHQEVKCQIKCPSTERTGQFQIRFQNLIEKSQEYNKTVVRGLWKGVHRSGSSANCDILVSSHEDTIVSEEYHTFSTVSPEIVYIVHCLLWADIANSNKYSICQNSRFYTQKSK